MDVTVQHDRDNNEFHIEVVKNEWAKITYKPVGDVIYVDHSSVPSSLRGQGKGSVMMEAALAEIEQLNWKIVAECSYVKHYLDKHSQWSHLVYQD